MIKAFEDSIERHPPEFATLDRLRAATLSKSSSCYCDTEHLTPFLYSTNTDNQSIPTKIIRETEV